MVSGRLRDCARKPQDFIDDRISEWEWLHLNIQTYFVMASEGKCPSRTIAMQVVGLDD
jgi:hypothetical protein